jgi:hypothetical protein
MPAAGKRGNRKDFDWGCHVRTTVLIRKLLLPEMSQFFNKYSKLFRMLGTNL